VNEGLTSLSQPGKLKNVGWTYPVLGVPFIADGISLFIAFRQLWKQKRKNESFWQSIKTSKDPSVFVVFGEEIVDVAGLLVAFLCVFLGHQLHSHYPDVIASIVVGLILAVVAVYLIYESKSLLIGEAAESEIIADIQKTVHNHRAVEKVQVPLSVQLSPDEIFLALNVEFKPDIEAAELNRVIDDLERQIHRDHHSVGRIFIEADKI
jgi:divalent metal cation (Fe/Co/Zn/Cd) transporter